MIVMQIETQSAFSLVMFVARSVGRYVERLVRSSGKI